MWTTFISQRYCSRDGMQCFSSSHIKLSKLKTLLQNADEYQLVKRTEFSHVNHGELIHYCNELSFNYSSLLHRTNLSSILHLLLIYIWFVTTLLFLQSFSRVHSFQLCVMYKEINPNSKNYKNIFLLFSFLNLRAI